jgi:hypothetical protein
VVLSKRERYIGILTAAVLAILVLDRLVLVPLTQRRADLDQKIGAAREELARANGQFATAMRARRNWAAMAGSTFGGPVDPESRVLNSAQQWAQEAGMSLPVIRPDRTEREKEFEKITFRATGSGSMSQIGRFLDRLHTAEMPLRVTDLVLSSRKEGADDLSINLGIATIAPAPETDKSAPARPAPAAAAVAQPSSPSREAK